MIPAELTPRKLKLPKKDLCNIVIFTGTQLRHDRFALRIQQEFGQLVVGWYQVKQRTGHQDSRYSTAGRIIQKAKAVVRNPKKLFRTPQYLAQWILNRYSGTRVSQRQVEELLFGDEVRLLRENAHLEPRLVSDPNSPEIVDSVKSLNPYFLLTLGGAIYRKPLLKCARGLALNQHDGWCPAYRGSATVDWTLYKRDLAHVGNTVHILTSGMDAGPILRRSPACLIDDDTKESCFARVVALGTELLCEVVAEAIRSDEITVYEQLCEDGFTYLGGHLTKEVRRAVDRDLRNGWLRLELSRLRQF